MSTTIDALAAAIQEHEGWSPGSRSYRNNNPGNLRYAGQTGASGADTGGYAVFPSYQAGYNAMVSQINLDISRGSDAAGRPVNTLSDLLSSWAPSSENNTAAYIAAVSARTGIAPDQSLSSAVAGSAGGDSVDDSSGIDSSGSSTFADDFIGGSFSPTAVAVIGGASLLGAYFLLFR